MSMAPTTDPKIQLLAGVAAVDITGTATEQIADPLYAAIDAEITNDRLCVKALVLRDEITSVVVITVDAVAIAEIGSISNDYLTNVRAQLHEELSISARPITPAQWSAPMSSRGRCRRSARRGRAWFRSGSESASDTRTASWKTGAWDLRAAAWRTCAAPTPCHPTTRSNR